MNNNEVKFNDLLEEGAYKFTITDFDHTSDKYDYKLSQINHAIFFEQLIKKVSLVEKPSSYLIN